LIAEVLRNIIEEDRFRIQMACLTADSSIAEGIIQDCREIAEESVLSIREVFEHGAYAAQYMAVHGRFSFAEWRTHMRLWIGQK